MGSVGAAGTDCGSESAGRMHWTSAAIILVVVALITAIGFGTIMLRPLSWAQPIRMVTIEPGRHDTVNQEVHSSAFFSWPIVNADRANANVDTTGYTVENHRVDVSEATQDHFADRLAMPEDSRPLVVRLSGVPRRQDGHALLRPHQGIESPQTNHSGSINCTSIIDRLRSRSGPTLLWIEVGLPDELETQSFPEADAWEFQSLLHEQLQRHESDFLLSLVIDYTRFGLVSNPSPAIDSLIKDTNRNGTWECSEWLSQLSVTRTSLRTSTQARLQPHFVWTPSESGGWDFEIAPLQTLKTFATHRASTTQTDSKPESQTEPKLVHIASGGGQAVQKLDVLAPSMAMAIWSGTTPWTTRDADLAIAADAAWQTALLKATNEKPIEQWLSANAETAGHWREHRLAKPILDRPFPWSVRRDLLICLRQMEILATNGLVQRHFPSTWKALHQRWIEIQRRARLWESSELVASNVLVPAEVRRFRVAATEMAADCDVLLLAHQFTSGFNTDLSRWVNWPLTHWASVDAASEVLKAAVVLRQQLCQPELKKTESVQRALADLQELITRAEVNESKPNHLIPIDVPTANTFRKQRYQSVTQWRELELNPIEPDSIDQIGQQLNWIAQDRMNEFDDATQAEWMVSEFDLQQIEQWFNHLELPWTINVPRSIDLIVDRQERLAIGSGVTLEFIAQARDGEALNGRWSFDADPNVWEVVTSQDLSGENAAAQPASVCGHAIGLRKRSMPTTCQWIDCHFTSKLHRYRVSVPLLTSVEAIASVRWANANPVDLLPNTTSPVGVQIQSLDRDFRRVKVRLLAPNEPFTSKASEGTFIGLAAEQAAWDESNAIVLAEVEQLSLTAGQMTLVPFPAIKIDPQIPVTDAQWLRLEIHDLDATRVHCLNVHPSVGRPMAWLSPKVRFDHYQRKLTINAGWIVGRYDNLVSSADESIANGSNLRARIVDPKTNRTLAQSTIIFGIDSPDIELSSATTDRPFDVVIDAFGWPNAFRYRIDPETSVEQAAVSRQIQGIQWHASMQPTLKQFGPGKMVTSAAIDVQLSDEEFRYGQDQIAIGIDRNQNRYLDGEETFATASAPIQTEFQWAGIDDQGRIEIRNRVMPQHFDVSVAEYQNERIDVLAEFRRGTNRWSTPPRGLLIDLQPPRVTKVIPTEGGPYEWSKPITLWVEANDGDLSGVQRIEAAWSVEGSLEFGKDVKTFPAGQSPDGKWSVTMPTQGLPVGIAVAMVRATDRLGNVSDIQTLDVNLQTAAEIAAIANQPSSAVQGQVRYVTQPVSTINVRLERIPQTDPAKDLKPPAGTTEQTDKPLEVVTDATGRFFFPKIRPGQYRVSVDGLYRGVRRQESVVVSVVGHQMVQVPVIQIR